MSNAIQSRNNFAKALRTVRKSKGLSQEAFSLSSSRTFVSSLERGTKSATLGKIDDLAEVLGVHPMTLLAMSYLRNADPVSIERLLDRVTAEFAEI